MAQRNRRGISRPLIIAGIVLVFVLGVVAFMVARNSGKKSNQSSKKELVISEWKVQIPMSEGNRDLYYTIVTYRGQDYGQGARIYSKDIDDLKNENGISCKNADYPLFVISRVHRERGVQMSNPSSVDYDAIAAPFKSHSFQSEYAFGGGHNDQTKAPCLNLNSGTGRLYKEDADIAKKYNAKIQAIKKGFEHLQTTEKQE